MLHLMLPPYERSLNTVLLVDGDQVGDFSTQLLNAFFKVRQVCFNATLIGEMDLSFRH